MQAGYTYKYTIPSCLKAGYYLVRHETIALHASWEYPGAQFYPHCHQLKVSGSGSTVPSSLVSFPGAYKASDPGITYDAYKGKSSSLSIKSHRANFSSPNLHCSRAQCLYLLVSRWILFETRINSTETADNYSLTDNEVEIYLLYVFFAHLVLNSTKFNLFYQPN